jgi:hypothetical protein
MQVDVAAHASPMCKNNLDFLQLLSLIQHHPHRTLLPVFSPMFECCDSTGSHC